jgi:hypothetical protein
MPRCPRHVGFTPNSGHSSGRLKGPLRAMYGRRPRCKRNLTFCEAFGCSHVFGLFSLEDCLHRDAANVAAGPDVIR